MYETTRQKCMRRLDRKCMKDQIENVLKTRQNMYERLDRKCMKDQIENV